MYLVQYMRQNLNYYILRIMIGHNKLGKKMIRNYCQSNHYKLNYNNIKKLLEHYKRV